MRIRDRRDALGPDLLGLAHRDPDVGVHEVDARDAGLHVIGEEDARARLGRDRLGLRHHHH